MYKTVILDLDQTITTDSASWVQFTERIGADKNEHLKIYENFKSGKISYEKAKTDLICLWKSVNPLKLNDIKDVFSNIELREGAIEAIKYLKSKYNICIISGAIDVFVNIIADKLEIDYRYASTKFLFDNKDVLYDFEYKLSRGEEKKEFLKDYCEKTNTKYSECVAIGDGESDMPIFEIVGLPILFIANETNDEQKDKIKTQLGKWSEIHKLL